MKTSNRHFVKRWGSWLVAGSSLYARRTRCADGTTPARIVLTHRGQPTAKSVRSDLRPPGPCAPLKSSTAATAITSPPENVTMCQLRTTRLPLFAMPARRVFIVTSVAASALLITTASHGQPEQVPGSSSAAPSNAQQYPEPVNPATLSCNALKARMQSTGELRILSGPRGGWADTFYGPRVPRCQFWQMPQFAYVRTSDGLCGAGYICVDKMSVD